MDYDIRGRAQAIRMLAPKPKGKGQVLTIIKPSAGGAYDPTTGGVEGATPANQTGSGVILPYNTFIRMGVRNEPGSEIQAGDQQLLLSPVQANGTDLAAPKVGDQLQAGAKTYTFTSISALAPAGTVILFDCNLRGA